MAVLWFMAVAVLMAVAVVLAIFVAISIAVAGADVGAFVLEMIYSSEKYHAKNGFGKYVQIE